MGASPVRSRADSGDSRLFVTDYDGTLLRDDRTIHPRDLNTLARLKAAGMTTVIATGRSLYSFIRSLEAICLGPEMLFVDYLVFSTGAGIMDLSSGKMLRALDLCGKDILAACTYFDERGFDYMIHNPIPETPYFLYTTHGRPNPDFHARIALYPDFGRPLAGSHPSRATEVLAIVPRDQLRLSRADIQSALDQTSVIFATSPLDKQSVWIEVFHRKVSKSRAMAWLSNRLEAGPDDVVAVGNDYNDLDLLQWSGKAFVVENGPKGLGKDCIRVPSNNCCGVTHAAEAGGLLDASSL
jgi:hydroxymethylpyrimidine pyrophosphatase-like HAD family hydrolase